MPTDDKTSEDGDESEFAPEEADSSVEVRDRLADGAGRAVTGFDDGLVDLLAWVLDTETRARIYVFLRQHADSTSEEVADGTGLYPSTVREALAELHDEGKVTRGKRQSSGAGNNPYEYRAIPPSDLVDGIVDQVQSELNAVFNLDRRLGTDDSDDVDPVTITVDDD
jgi:predicted transcriptional regulator